MDIGNITKEVAEFIKSYKPLVFNINSKTILTVSVSEDMDIQDYHDLQDQLADIFECDIMLFASDCKITNIANKEDHEDTDSEGSGD